MTKHEANRWLEAWADRWGITLEPWVKLRPGEKRNGLLRQARDGECIPGPALEEIRPMFQQLSFEEFGPLPAPGVPSGSGGGGEPPIDNMGGKLTEPLRGYALTTSLATAVDWSNLVGKGDDARRKCVQMLTERLGEGQEGLSGLHGYGRTWHFEGGCIMAWGEGREDWLVSVNGRTFEVVGQENHLRFLLDLDRFTDHCTRLDVRIDDYSRGLIDLEKIEAARQAGNFSGYRRCGKVGDDKVVGGKLVSLGDTITFGRRGKGGSGRFMRFYDKALESKGRIMSTRAEAEYSKQHAGEAWKHLVHAIRQGEQAATLELGKLVVGAIDFVQRGEETHLDRMHRLEWWALLVDTIGQVRIKITRAVSTLTGCMGAFIRQYGRKIGRAAVVAEAKGYDFYLQLWGALERCRTGQELDDRDLSPGELLFEPATALRI